MLTLFTRDFTNPARSTRLVRKPLVTVVLTLACLGISPLMAVGASFDAGVSVHQEYVQPAERGVIGVEFQLPASSQGGGYPSIIQLLPGAPAHRSGLRLGDTILSVDGLPAQGMSRRALDAAISDVPGTVVRFEVFRPGHGALKIPVTVQGQSQVRAAAGSRWLE